MYKFCISWFLVYFSWILIMSSWSCTRVAVLLQAGGNCHQCLHSTVSIFTLVRAFAHGAMGRSIDPSWGGPIEVYLVICINPPIYWCNKGCGMCNPVCGMVHIKEPLLLIKKSSPCGGSGYPLSLSEWSFTICLTPYNRK